MKKYLRIFLYTIPCLSLSAHAASSSENTTIMDARKSRPVRGPASVAESYGTRATTMVDPEKYRQYKQRVKDGDALNEAQEAMFAAIAKKVEFPLAERLASSAATRGSSASVTVDDVRRVLPELVGSIDDMVTTFVRLGDACGFSFAERLKEIGMKAVCSEFVAHSKTASSAAADSRLAPVITTLHKQVLQTKLKAVINDREVFIREKVAEEMVRYHNARAEAYSKRGFFGSKEKIPEITPNEARAKILAAYKDVLDGFDEEISTLRAAISETPEVDIIVRSILSAIDESMAGTAAGAGRRKGSMAVAPTPRGKGAAAAAAAAPASARRVTHHIDAASAGAASVSPLEEDDISRKTAHGTAAGASPTNGVAGAKRKHDGGGGSSAAGGAGAIAAAPASRGGYAGASSSSAAAAPSGRTSAALAAAGEGATAASAAKRTRY